MNTTKRPTATGWEKTAHGPQRPVLSQPAKKDFVAEQAAVPDLEQGDGTAIPTAEQLIELYRQRAAYPSYSQPLKEGPDPLLYDREVTHTSAGGPDGEDPILTVFPEQISFELTELPKMFAFLTVGGEKVAAREVTGTVFTQEMVPVGELVFHDDGLDGDPVAFDNVYTATWSPQEEDVGPATSYFVRVVALTFEGTERRAGMSFQVSRPYAALTGRFQDRLDQGNLVIEVELEVNTSGRFHLAGTLYTQTNRPIGLGQTSVELEPGVHWVPLRFYGRLFHGVDTGLGPVHGPYVLRFVSLMTTSSMPHALNRLAEPQFVTQAYRAEQFISEPFNDPFYLEAIERESRKLRRSSPATTEIPQ